MASRAQDRDAGTVRFSRVLGLSSVVALGATVTIGLGVFTLLGHIVRLSGSGSGTEAYLFFFIAAIPLALTYAERAGVLPGSSAYHLARRSGWLWLTYASGWLMLGGYASLVAVLAWGAGLHVNLLLQPFFELSLDSGWLGAAVIALVVFTKLYGKQDWRKTRTTIVALSILVLLLIILRDLVLPESLDPASPAYRSSRSPLSVATLLASTLWGWTFILQLRDEVRRPTRTIPQGLLLTLFIGAGLGLLGAWAISRYPGSTGNSLTPLVDIAAGFGLIHESVTMVLYSLSGLSIILIALNRGIAFALRLIGDMTGDGFFPLTPHTGSNTRSAPQLQLALFALLSMLLVGFVPELTLAGLAAMSFLWTTVLIHLPDVLRTKPYLPAKRRPKLPFHPLFPGLTVAIGVLLPFYLERDVWWVGLAWVVIGAAVYAAYAHQSAVAARREAVVVGEEDADAARKAPTKPLYRVMVNLTDRDGAGDVVRMGARLAQARKGELLVLKLLHLPDYMARQVRQRAAQEEWETLKAWIGELGLASVSVRPLVRLAPQPADGIMEAVSEENVNLLVLKWESEGAPDEKTPDPTINDVVRYVGCDVVVVRGRVPEVLKRVLVPTAGGPHAAVALGLGRDLVDPKEGELALVNIVAEEPTAEQEAAAAVCLEDTLGSPRAQERGRVERPIKQRVLESGSVQDGVVAEAESADLMLVGASKGSIFDASYFGGLATQLAFASPIPTLVACGRERERFVWLRVVWDSLTDALPALTKQRQAQVIEQMRAGAQPTVDFFVLIILAASIATLGLLQDSAAVIIGAMLVAPLMSPILAMAMGVLLGDLRLLSVGTESMIKGAAMAILVGAAVSILSPLNATTGQILARTQPNVLDLGVAVVSGVAAGYTVSRAQVASALPGVSISVALVPPLCVVGYGISVSEPSIAGGALLLFLTNLFGIIFAAALTFAALGIQPTHGERQETTRGLRVTLVGLGIIAGILAFYTVGSVQRLNRSQKLEDIFSQEVVARAGRVEELEVEKDDDGWLLTGTVINFEENQLTTEQLALLEEEISSAMGEPVTIDASILAASRSQGDLVDLSDRRLLEDRFIEEVTARNARVLDLLVEGTQEGYEIEAAIVVYDQAGLADEEIAQIEQQLSEEVEAPVEIQYVVLEGRRTDSEGVEAAIGTPTPELSTPSPTNMTPTPGGDSHHTPTATATPDQESQPPATRNSELDTTTPPAATPTLE